MNHLEKYRVLVKNIPALALFSGSSLLIMASDRLAHAIITAGALIWTHCLGFLAIHYGARIFPAQGRVVLFTFLYAFIASVYLFLLWIASPILAFKMFFIICLVPVFSLNSKLFEKFEAMSLHSKLFASFSEAALLGALIIIFSLIREPFGYLSLSLPGGALGLIPLFSSDSESFFNVQLIASSSGALLLTGYFLGLYRYLMEKKI